VVAYKILDSLSVAVGPTFNYSKIGFNRGLATANDYFEFKGDDFSYGLTAGIMWQPIKQLSFGVDYRLASTMHYSGTSTYNTGGGQTFQMPTSARVPFPETISGGISYRPTPKWNVEVDVDYIDWHPLGDVTLNGTAPVFGNNLVLHLNWHDSMQYKAGVTRYFDNGWFASCGYFFSTDTTDSADYTAAVPDSNLHVGSIGVGRNGEHWHWALSGQLIAGSRSVAPAPGNTINPVDTSAGTYAFFVPAVTVSVGYHF
jgi:long-chain fatty acid transport protein